MIQPSIPKSVKKRRLIREGIKNNRENSQSAINNLLWKIIMQNGGTIAVPVEEMEQIPDDSALKVTVDSTTNKLVVVAGTRPTKNGLWLPPGAGE